jgi:four helix bundle protein
MKDEKVRMHDERPEELGERTKKFALRVVRLVGALPKNTVGNVIGKQILRSGTSVGAQYREAKRAKSNADFISKIEGALQELDETIYWLELLTEAGFVKEELLKPLMEEADQLIAIFVTIVKKVKSQSRAKVIS